MDKDMIIEIAIELEHRLNKEILAVGGENPSFEDMQKVVLVNQLITFIKVQRIYNCLEGGFIRKTFNIARRFYKFHKLGL